MEWISVKSLPFSLLVLGRLTLKDKIGTWVEPKLAIFLSLSCRCNLNVIAGAIKMSSILQRLELGQKFSG